MFEPEAVDVQGEANGFANKCQQQYVIEQRKSVMAMSKTQTNIAQVARPSCGKDHHQENDAKAGVAQRYPSMDAALLACLGTVFARCRYAILRVCSCRDRHLVRRRSGHLVLIDQGFSRL